MFTEKEKQLYSRQLLLPHFGEEKQQKLKNASVLVVGAGGLGSPVLLYLAAAGIGRLAVVDNDVVELSNLQRQLLYKHAEIGLPKAEMAVRELAQHNPFIQLNCYAEQLTPNNADALISDYDIIVGALDNSSARYLIDEVCAKWGKVYVHGSISQYEGQVAVFHYQNKGSYRNLFPEAPPTDFAQASDKAVFAPLPGTIGTLMAAEVIKVITEQGDVLAGKMLLVDLKNNAFTVLKY